MKHFFISGLLVLALGMMSTVNATSSTGWRLVVIDTIGGDHPVNIAEVEFLHDHDDDVDTAKIDGTESDLGVVACGWTRSVPNLTGNDTPIAVGCDSVGTNRLPQLDPEITNMVVPEGERRHRLGKLAFDDSILTYFETKNKITTNNKFHLQYIWYVGGSAPGRVLPDVTGYSITVLDEYLLDKAPVKWRVEYRTSGGNWATVHEVEEGFFTNGTTVSVGEIDGKKLTFTLP